MVTYMGGKTDYPSIGAAMGIERLMLLLEPIRDQLPLSEGPAIQIILPLDKEQYDLALLLADELQTHNICVDILLDGGSLKSMMRKAHKMGVQHALIIGS